MPSFNSKAARARKTPDQMSAQVAGRMRRAKMGADWQTVHAMLTGKAPRRDGQGRNVWEVWADLVLENPPLEYARVIREILPQEMPDSSGTNAVITNIQSLYLTALTAANQKPVNQIEGESGQGANGVQSDLSDW